MNKDKALELAAQYGGVWDEHPDYPVSDWKYEVACNDTRLGYWDWVAHQGEINALQMDEWLNRLRSADPVSPVAGTDDQPPGPWEEFEERFGGINLFDSETKGISDDPEDGDVLWDEVPDGIDTSYVWTVVEGDAGHQDLVAAGIRAVNRLGYVIVSRPRCADPMHYRDYYYEEN